MSKKDKYDDEYGELKREIIRDKIKEVFFKDSNNYIEGLEEIGFTWFDDEYPSEEDEENTAVPENDNQKFLVSYFEGEIELSEKVLTTLQTERNTENPNYPLIRKYFRSGNTHLKNLILYGLKNNPTSFDFLTDLMFFHEFESNLPELINYFTKACRLEDDLQKFSELATEFYYGTNADGYEALYALRKIFDEGRFGGKGKENC